jgi:hypothetical protein
MDKDNYNQTVTEKKHVARRPGVSKGNCKRHAREKNMWTGDMVCPRASLKDMQKKKHVDRRLGGSKGNCKQHVGEKNMWTGDLICPRAILNGMQD